MAKFRRIEKELKNKIYELEEYTGEPLDGVCINCENLNPFFKDKPHVHLFPDKKFSSLTDFKERKVIWLINKGDYLSKETKEESYNKECEKHFVISKQNVELLFEPIDSKSKKSPVNLKKDEYCPMNGGSIMYYNE
jgi:hypothetical protein